MPFLGQNGPKIAFSSNNSSETLRNYRKPHVNMFLWSIMTHWCSFHEFILNWYPATTQNSLFWGLKPEPEPETFQFPLASTKSPTVYRLGRPPYIVLVAHRISSWSPTIYRLGRPPYIVLVAHRISSWSPTIYRLGRPPYIVLVAHQFTIH